MFSKISSIMSVSALCFLLFTNLSYSQSWTELSPTGSAPTTREGATAVYNTTNNQMIIFGGSSPVGLLNDVWVLSTANGLGGIPSWTQITTTESSPTTLYGHSAIYDNANQRMTIFAGYNNGNYLNEVWVLSTVDFSAGTCLWTQLFPTGSFPTTRELHSTVYDAVSNRMILFGGYNNAAGELNDLWILTNANGLGGTPVSSQISPTGTPPTKRYAHTAVYDTTNNQMIIFGGYSNTTFYNDVWVLSHANGLGGVPAWSKLSPIGNLPEKRAYHTAVYDGVHNTMTIFGGDTSANNVNDIWVLYNANGLSGTPYWIQMSPAGNLPLSRYSNTAVYDSSNNRMIIMGGYHTDYLNDVWTLSTANGYGIWSNSIGDFDIPSDSTYWALENAPNNSILAPYTWLSTYQSNTGILKVTFDTSTEGLKLTSIPRFIPNPSQPWYRVRVTYYCDSPCTGESILPVILSYTNNSSQSIQEIGAAYSGNSLIQSGNWYTLDCYIYCLANSCQLQLVMKNGGSTGAMYIDSIALDNVIPSAYNNPVYSSITGAPMTSSSDTTFWGYDNAPGQNSKPQISWLSSYNTENNVLSMNFNSSHQGVKMTSLLGTIPTDRNAILSFNAYVTNPADITIQGFLYGEKSLNPFQCDIGAYVNIGDLPSNTWTTLYVPLSSVSLQTTFRLQLLIKNNNQFPEQVYINNIRLIYSSVVGYDSFEIQGNKNSQIEMPLR